MRPGRRRRWCSKAWRAQGGGGRCRRRWRGKKGPTRDLRPSNLTFMVEGKAEGKEEKSPTRDLVRSSNLPFCGVGDGIVALGGVRQGGWYRQPVAWHPWRNAQGMFLQSVVPRDGENGPVGGRRGTRGKTSRGSVSAAPFLVQQGRWPYQEPVWHRKKRVQASPSCRLSSATRRMAATHWVLHALACRPWQAALSEVVHRMANGSGSAASGTRRTKKGNQGAKRPRSLGVRGGHGVMVSWGQLASLSPRCPTGKSKWWRGAKWPG